MKCIINIDDKDIGEKVYKRAKDKKSSSYNFV